MPDKEPSFDQHRWEYEQNRALAERAHDQESHFFEEMNERASNNANIALRTLLLINGGAAVTMLAFIGNLVSVDGAQFSNMLADLTSPMLWFVWGVALTVVAIGFAYFTTYCFVAGSYHKGRHYEHPFIRETSASKRWLRAGGVCQIIAILLALASLGFFIYGMRDVRNAISALHNVEQVNAVSLTFVMRLQSG